MGPMRASSIFEDVRAGGVVTIGLDRDYYDRFRPRTEPVVSHLFAGAPG